MDNEKNKKDFHVIFYLTSPRRGQFQSDDQCTGAEVTPEKGEKWIHSFHIFKRSQNNRHALQKRLEVLKALSVSVLENSTGPCETP